MNPIYINRALRFIFVLCAIIFGVIAFLYLAKIAYPFFIGLIIAFLMNPLVNLFEKKGHMPRALAVFLGLIIIVALFAGLITLLIAEIVSGANYLARVVPENLDTIIAYIEKVFAAQIIPFYNHITSIFNKLDVGQQNTIMENIQNVGKKIGTTAGSFIQSFFGNIPNILSWFPNAATVLIISFLATFFISKDWYKLSAIGGKILPGKAKESGRKVFIDLKKALFGFIRTQLTLISITTIIILIGLLILRVDYAITIALIIGIAELLPYIGTGSVFIPWIIYETIGGDVKLAIGLGVLFVIVIVQRQISEPKILSSSIGIDPLATLISMFIGFKLLGFLGLILGPVIVVIIGTLYRANVFHDIWTFIKGKEA
ncbi:MAG: sporulation integral membrane protein YtvI [Bacillota bacterium]|nr:sporulation integral membrane protein YtvI [Bacillota bacterium]